MTMGMLLFAGGPGAASHEEFDECERAYVSFQ